MTARFMIQGHHFFPPASLFALLTLVAGMTVQADEQAYKAIEPILATYCYDCHGDGMDSGDFAMDDFQSIAEHLRDFDVWYEIWKNVRSNLMPPADKPQFKTEEREKVLTFIETSVFKIDRSNPDPGRVTIRRLNREEYRHSIKDLLRIDFKVEDILPADDTGYGFDTIGDVLSISPLLMEKYLEAATLIVENAIPTDGPGIVEWWFDAKRFKDERNADWGVDWLPFDHARKMQSHEYVSHDGEYEVMMDFRIRGSSEATSNTVTLMLGVGEQELARRKLGWDNSERITLKAKTALKKGREAPFWFATEVGDPPQEGENKLGIEVQNVRIRGPLDGSKKDYPWNTRYLFSEGPPPVDETQRDPYRESIIRKFANQAFRRPVDDATIARLVGLAREVDLQPNNTFEDGIAEAVTAILVSPRFLLRAEVQPEPNNPGKVVPIDEYSLASRLSYFLWSSVPDEELLKLAGENKLRANLRSQIDRLLKDDKSKRFITNFVGQWLQARDVETLAFDERRLLEEKDFETARKKFNGNLRQSMRLESESFFAHVLREKRPATELLTANYTYLNEILADWYKIEGVKGSHLRKVDLPEASHRGGILTQGTFQLVTSNPTRTSPVKRGLFVLENFLATPPPPAVPDVPPLEESAKGENKNLTLREVLKIHAEQKLCASCHMRMDPIGLALENYNAIGVWRDTEKGQPIDASGQLMTGEKFTNARELSTILASARKSDFHRAISEKLLTYAVGRGIEYFDAPTIDKIVADAEKAGGSLLEILYGVVESAPFQKRRGDGEMFASAAGE
jgi:mono/diheme cytochrome c family protein